jgi:hypothetical protein
MGSAGDTAGEVLVTCPWGMARLVIGTPGTRHFECFEPQQCYRSERPGAPRPLDDLSTVLLGCQAGRGPYLGKLRQRQISRAGLYYRVCEVPAVTFCARHSEPRSVGCDWMPHSRVSRTELEKR